MIADITIVTGFIEEMGSKLVDQMQTMDVELNDINLNELFNN